VPELHVRLDLHQVSGLAYMEGNSGSLIRRLREVDAACTRSLARRSIPNERIRKADARTGRYACARAGARTETYEKPAFVREQLFETMALDVARPTR